MPWVAFAQALASKQTAAHSAMFDDGLLRVFRAAGKKTAMLTQQRTNSNFVQAQQGQQQGFHQMLGRG